MLKDVQNSIKAKLYDFTYSPFMSSMIIAWIIINHKYILIYMSSYDLDKKLLLLKEYDFTWHTNCCDIPRACNIWIPILFGLFYTFIYPMASKKFYEYTLEKNKELKKIKQDIEDITPITQDEARTLRASITLLTENKYELEKKLIEVEDRYKKKVEKFDDEKFQLTRSEYNNKIIKPKEDDETKVLRFFYESNYTPNRKELVLDNIIKKTKLVRLKAETILNELLNKIILVESKPHRDAFYSNIYITDKGNSMLLEMFDKEE